jgi:hypothetical protein
MTDTMPESAAPSPVAQRPTLPEGYGLPDTADGLLTWDQVQVRLVGALHYWIATVRPDGRPHLVPRWGVWFSGRFFYDGAPTTVHARNLADNPHVSLSLEDGKEAVIVEGLSEPTRADPEGLGAELAAAFGKYHDLGYQPGPDSWSGDDGGGLRVITPRRALAWFSFPTDCTRFSWS